MSIQENIPHHPTSQFNSAKSLRRNFVTLLTIFWTKFHQIFLTVQSIFPEKYRDNICNSAKVEENIHFINNSFMNISNSAYLPLIPVHYSTSSLCAESVSPVFSCFFRTAHSVFILFLLKILLHTPIYLSPSLILFILLTATIFLIFYPTIFLFLTLPALFEVATRQFCSTFN